MKNIRVLVRGGGDLASGVVACLHRAGWQVLVCELPAPLVVRRKVAFAEAVYEGKMQVEGIDAQLAHSYADVEPILESGRVAVLVDPELTVLESLRFKAVVDARLLKRDLLDDNPKDLAIIGLGPGFEAGENCKVAIETNRGPNLGQILWEGKPEADTGKPAAVNGYSLERVLYAPAEGIVKHYCAICDVVEAGQLLAEVGGLEVKAKIAGVVRGLIREGIRVKKGIKIADIDPRMDSKSCYKISDKAIIIGCSVLEAMKSIEKEFVG